MSEIRIAIDDKTIPDQNQPVPAEDYDSDYYALYYPESGFLRGELDRRTEKATGIAGLKDEMQVLDIGCGPGDLAIVCASKGCFVQGVDYSESAIQLARQWLNRQPQRVIDHVSFSVMNAKQLEFSDEYFDLVFMTDVVEHLHHEELEQALREAMRVLKPDGRLIVRTAPNAWLVKPIYAVAKVMFAVDSWDTEYYHVNELSARSMSGYLTNLAADYKVTMGKANENYFSGHLPTVAGARVRFVARQLDRILDSSLGISIIFGSPLKYFFGTEIWGIVEKGAGAH